VPPRRLEQPLRPGLPLGFFLALALGIATGCGRQDRPDPAQSTTPATPSGQSVPSTLPSAAVFRDVTREARLEFVHQLADGDLTNIMESDGAGGTVLDYDGDGWMDLYLVNSGPDPIMSDAPPDTPRHPNRLFRNLGNRTFADVTEQAGVAGHGFGTTAAAADYDNDGDTDLLVVNFGSVILYQNQGDGTFRDVTEAAGLNNPRAGISATFLDVDRDGWLDLFVANYLVFDPTLNVEPGSPQPYPGPLAYPPEYNVLYRNRGDGSFADVSEASGIRIPDHRAMSVTALDFDLDGDVDLYVSNDGTPNLLLDNDGQGRFRDVGWQRGVAFNQFGDAAGSMGAAVADVNRDGFPDILVTRFGQASLYLNSKGGFFEDRITASGILDVSSQLVGWGGNFLDFDNDGDPDIFIANGDPHFLKGMPPLLLENRGDATFTSAGPRAGPFFQTLVNGRGSGAVDFDNDGRRDVVITTLGGPAILLRNELESGHHWLTLQLEGTRSNRDGFGALVQVMAGGRTLAAEARCPTVYVFQQETRLHFGLGPAKVVERIAIRWPSGQLQELTQVAVDQILAIREPGESRWPARQPRAGGS
jgi:hypothetical protein